MLTPNFTFEEVTRSTTATRFGIPNDLPPALKENVQLAAMGMERIRKRIVRPIHVESWYRSPAVNRAVGGAANSKHMQGLAIDWWPADGKQDLLEVARLLSRSKEDIGFDQLIMEGSWLHTAFPPLGKEPELRVMTAHFSPGLKTIYTEGLA